VEAAKAAVARVAGVVVESMGRAANRVRLASLQAVDVGTHHLATRSDGAAAAVIGAPRGRR
jgi:hypothetical protein